MQNRDLEKQLLDELEKATASADIANKALSDLLIRLEVIYMFKNQSKLAKGGSNESRRISLERV